MKVENSELKIEYKNSGVEFCFVCFAQSMKIQIEMPVLKEIEISGASRDKIDGFSNLDNLKVAIRGSSLLKLSNGDAKQISGEIRGASQLDAENFEIVNTDLKISGSSLAKLAVSGILKADVSGASSIFYKGNPQLQTKVSGTSVVSEYVR